VQHEFLGEKVPCTESHIVAYLGRVKTSGVWLSAIEVEAAADALRVPIHVWGWVEGSKLLGRVRPGDNAVVSEPISIHGQIYPGTPLNVVYEGGNHYRALVDVRTPQEQSHASLSGMLCSCERRSLSSTKISSFLPLSSLRLLWLAFRPH